MSNIDIAFGFSRHYSAEEAVREASVQLRSKSAFPKIDLCIVFFNLPLEEARKIPYSIKRVLNPRTVIGCSLPFLVAEHAFFKRGLIIIGFSGIEFSAGIFSEEKDMAEASERFIWRILRQAQHKRRSFFLSFARFKFSSVSNFLKGIERGLGRNFPFSGIFSCEEESTHPLLLLHNENIITSGAVGILFFDNPDIFLETGSGFSPLGKGGRVTSFSRNLIKEIDNKPAVDFYRDYFGEKIIHSNNYFKKVISRYPLGFKAKDFSGYIIGIPRAFNSDGSISFLKDVLSDEIKLMIPVRHSLINALSNAAKDCKDKIRKPRICFFFDSFYRYRLLGAFYYRQIEALKEAVGEVGLVGGVSFYGMGTLHSSRIGLGHFILENSFSFITAGQK
ncbi:MAG: hypothetical protein JW734_00330 [Candidatus Omnitrophica bacterium]|nr:hypothetical protein [Candidatus Omnitrophota bacterium]